MREVQFDGLVGPTHNYGGLSAGNQASLTHGGQASNPRAAARQGLAKMAFVASLGVPQAVLPPHERPHLPTLRALGFRGSDEEVLTRAFAHDDLLVRRVSSASAMWAANAATVIPSRDASDGRVHLMPANLRHMPHRALEAEVTTRVLRAIFASPRHFVVEEPLPGGAPFADEGAANHLRLATAERALHLFAWGRAALTSDPVSAPEKHPARQTREASLALARLGAVDPSNCRFPQQAPGGIDGGAFHTDVLAVGNGRFLMLHEQAFVDQASQLAEWQNALGSSFHVVLAASDELPLASAVSAYPFNAQVLSVGPDAMVIVAPDDAQGDPAARAFLERVVASGGPVKAVHYLDVRQSMRNGGGPACLRLRVPLEDAEASALAARVLLTPALLADLEAWVDAHYRDRLTPGDLKDPALARETMAALDALTGLFSLGSIYDFQRASTGKA